MPSTYTTNLGIELPADGELDGVWGDVVNDNMSILDRGINGVLSLSLSGTSSTLTTSDGALSDGQYKLLLLAGSPSGTHTITFSPNDAQKIYFVRNTTAQSVVFTQGSGGNVTIATGDSGIIYADGAGAGAAIANLTDHFAMSSVNITGGTINGTTIGASTPSTIAGTTGTFSGNLSVDTITNAAGGNTAQINGMTPTAQSLQGFRNRLFNGSYAVAQRGTTFASGSNDDDTYNLDRWYVLSDGNDAVDITQDTAAAPPEQKFCLALDVETANKKFGVAQIIENINCADLQGQTVTVAFQAKVSATTKLDNVKCAIVAWSGTADSVTGDIISAWGAEGTNPTLIANATYENTPANLNVTTAWATYTVSAPIDTASTNNVIVFIWSDVTDTTAGDFLYLAGVQLEAGSVATPFERRDYGTELARCQRYYYQDAGVGVDSYAVSTSIAAGTYYLPVTMRVAPAISQTGSVLQSGGTAQTTFTTNPAPYSDAKKQLFAVTSNATGRTQLYRPVQFDAEL